MPLTNATIKAAQPQAKPYKLADEKGMYLEIAPSGGKWWRLKYRIDGKEKRISLGTYPDVGLKEAREKREEARRLLAAGIDPGENRKAQKATGTGDNLNSFEVVTREWFARQRSTWVDSHADKILSRLERDLFPWLGKRPISAITAPELLSALRRIEERGAVETAHRALQNCGQIFRYAIVTGRAERDPTPALRGALPPVKQTHYKSKTDVGRFPGKDSIEKAVLGLQRLLSNRDSVDFFKVVVDDKNEYLDLEEDYRDLHEFFTNQLHTWQQLQSALRRFDKNKQALEKNESARKALIELNTIEGSAAPYNQLNRVAGLIETVEGINAELLTEQRHKAINHVDEKLAQLQAEIDKSGIVTPELCNRLLRPLQLIKTDIAAEASIATILMLQSQTADERLHEAVDELESAIQSEAERVKRLLQVRECFLILKATAKTS